MGFSDNLIERVREESDIVGLISEYTELTKKGQSYFGRCPFHHEKTPSFSVSAEKQMYYCFGCGAGGNIITFFMEKENMTFAEVIGDLAERANIPIEYSNTFYAPKKEDIAKKDILFELYRETARFYYYALKRNNEPQIRQYLIERGLDEKIIKKFGIGYAPSDYNILYKYLKNQGYSETILVESGLCKRSERTNAIYDTFSNRLMFPIFNPLKKVIAFGGRVFGDAQPKYLNSPESLLFDKSRTLYGLNLAKAIKHDYYILVEGYMDVIAMHQAGFSQTVASLGTAFTQFHAKLLKRYTKKVVILYDTDNAGQKATLRAIPLLREQDIEVKVLQLEEAKDPDEFLQKFGADKLSTKLEEAKTDIWYQIKRLESDWDIKIPEQKIKFLQSVAQILGELTSSIEQSIYIQEIAIKYNVELNALETEIKRYYKHKANQPNETVLTPAVINQPSIQVDLLAVLYHQPHIYRYVEEYIEGYLFDEGVLKDFATKLIESKKSGNDLDLTYFTNNYLEASDIKLLSNIVMNNDVRYEDKIKLNKMLTDTIKKLNNQHLDKQLKMCEDVFEIQKLLSKKKVLDKLNIAFING